MINSPGTDTGYQRLTSQPVEPVADHPRLVAFQTGTAIEQRPPWCGTCERRTSQVLIMTPAGEPAIARCPACHPLTQ